MRRMYVSELRTKDSQTLSRSMENALEARRAGDLSRAEAACEAILTREPNRADAWHLLGLLRDEGDDLYAAVELIRQAIDLDPTNARYHFSLAAVFRKLGHEQRARQIYSHARQLEPAAAPVLAGVQE